jgi:hypothetical protein
MAGQLPAETAPKRRPSLREIAAELAKAGHLAKSGSCS